MEPEIKTLDMYQTIFRTFELKAKHGLELLEKAAGVNKILIAVDHGNYSAEVHYLGFNVKLVFMKNVSEGLGYLRWYHLYCDEVSQKQRGNLIFEHYFDGSGNISEEKNKGKSLYCLHDADFPKYFHKTLLRFCQAVDEKACSGFYEHQAS